MLNGLELTAEDLLARLVLLPPPLRAAAESEESAKAIETVLRSEGVTDEDKILAAQQIFCFALLGLVKPAEIAAELNDLLELHDPAKAEKISAAGRAKVFAGIENLVLQNYNPEIVRPPAAAAAPAAGTPSAGPTPSVPAGKPPAPVVIHRETIVSAVKPPPGGEPKVPMADLISKTVSAPRPAPAPARLELGKVPAPPPKVVNYTPPAPKTPSPVVPPPPPRRS